LRIYESCVHLCHKRPPDGNYLRTVFQLGGVLGAQIGNGLAQYAQGIALTASPREAITIGDSTDRSIQRVFAIGQSRAGIRSMVQSFTPDLSIGIGTAFYHKRNGFGLTEACGPDKQFMHSRRVSESRFVCEGLRSSEPKF
jgi:hypothetical protein